MGSMELLVFFGCFALATLAISDNPEKVLDAIKAILGTIKAIFCNAKAPVRRR